MDLGAKTAIRYLSKKPIEKLFHMPWYKCSKCTIRYTARVMTLHQYVKGQIQS